MCSSRFKVNTVWGWLEDDKELCRTIMEMVSKQTRSTRMGRFKKEALRKEERLLRKAMLEQEWKERRESMAREMVMDVEESSKDDGQDILADGMRMITLWAGEN